MAVAAATPAFTATASRAQVRGRLAAFISGLGAFKLTTVRGCSGARTYLPAQRARSTILAGPTLPATAARRAVRTATRAMCSGATNASVRFKHFPGDKRTWLAWLLMLRGRPVSREIVPSSAERSTIVTVSAAKPDVTCSGAQQTTYSAANDVTCNTDCQEGPQSSSTYCGASRGVPTYCCYRPTFQWSAQPSGSSTEPGDAVQAYPYFSLPVIVRSVTPASLVAQEA